MSDEQQTGLKPCGWCGRTPEVTRMYDCPLDDFDRSDDNDFAAWCACGHSALSSSSLRQACANWDAMDTSGPPPDHGEGWW